LTPFTYGSGICQLRWSSCKRAQVFGGIRGLSERIEELENYVNVEPLQEMAEEIKEGTRKRKS